MSTITSRRTIEDLDRDEEQHFASLLNCEVPMYLSSAENLKIDIEEEHQGKNKTTTADNYNDTEKISKAFLCAGNARRPSAIADWLWQGWIRTGVPAVLTGFGESGKGMLCSGLALAIAGGRDFLGHPTKCGKTLFISAEDDADEMISRIADISEIEGYPEENLDRITVIHTGDTGQGSSLLDQNMQPTPLLKKIREWVEKEMPVLVVIDTLAACAPAGKDLVGSSVATQYICGVTAFLRSSKNVDTPAPTILFTAHLRKPGKDNETRPNIHDVRDSSAISTSVRAVLILDRNGLSLDKCNGRRRVEKEYRVEHDQVYLLGWSSKPGLSNGSLQLDRKIYRSEIEKRATAEKKAISTATKEVKDDSGFY